MSSSQGRNDVHLLEIRYSGIHAKMLPSTNNIHLSTNLDIPDVWSLVVPDQLVQSNSVTSPGFNFINLAVILVNTRPETESDDKFNTISPLHLQLARLVGNLVEKTSSSMHLIIITNQSLVNSVNKVLKVELGRHITNGVLLKKKKPKLRFPSIRITMVDLTSIVEGHREHLDSMKKLFSKIENTLLLMPGDLCVSFDC